MEVVQLLLPQLGANGEPEIDSEHERELRNRFLNDLNEMYRELDKEESKKS